MLYKGLKEDWGGWANYDASGLISHQSRVLALSHTMRSTQVINTSATEEFAVSASPSRHRQQSTSPSQQSTCYLTAVLGARLLLQDQIYDVGTRLIELMRHSKRAGTATYSSSLLAYAP